MAVFRGNGIAGIEELRDHWHVRGIGEELRAVLSQVALLIDD